MSTSGTYQFGENVQLDDLIREAYERIGIIGNLETGLHLQSALLSGNLELASWPGKGLNLWLIKQEMIGIQPFQSTYVLPKSTVRVLEVVSSSPTSLTATYGGTAFSSSTSSGAASNCFVPTNTTGWVSSSNINPYIGWTFNGTTPYSVNYVGFLPLLTGASEEYKLAIECASGDLSSYETVYTTENINCRYGVTQWFVIENSRVASSWRIRKIGGSAPALAVQQIYFAAAASTVGQGDTLMSPLSRADWMSLSYKNTMNPGQTSGFSYYFDQKITPTLTLYPLPTSSNFNTIYYTNYRYAQDLLALFQQVDVPPRFYDALVSGLSARLATKFAPDKYELLAPQAMQAYQIAAQTDSEQVPLRITPDFTAFGGY